MLQMVEAAAPDLLVDAETRVIAVYGYSAMSKGNIITVCWEIHGESEIVTCLSNSQSHPPVTTSERIADGRYILTGELFEYVL